ncbi:MAG: TetR/AcrR family transcriptional regulator [Clostridiales bacterium]|jgi:AcrR family transcriptional regulator|nr:TetR/AcrR family transcriptional regulator [Clostridiales bacterium]
MAVTKQAIIEVSIDILNRDGIENLSMRTIAKALGVKAAALYNHISGKQELFAIIMERLCMGIELPEEDLPPLDYLMAAHKAYRQILLTVRDSVVVAENSLPVTPKRVEIIRGISNKLMEFGVSRENLMTVSNMLNNYVLSFTADEARIKNAPPEMLKNFKDMLAPDERVMFISQRDYDVQFEYGLRILFAGIKAVQQI